MLNIKKRSVLIICLVLTIIASGAIYISADRWRVIFDPKPWETEEDLARINQQYQEAYLQIEEGEEEARKEREEREEEGRKARADAMKEYNENDQLNYANERVNNISSDKVEKFEIPKVDVSINGQLISVVSSQSEEYANASKLPHFEKLVKNIDEFPYVNFGDSVDLLFDFMPEKNELIVYDRIITKTGEYKYSTNATETINIGLIENKGAFEINVNPAAMLSSNLEDYQPGETIRGFSFSTNIEGENYLYAFAIRTDAK